MRRTILGVMVLFAVGCTDKAKPAYDKCVRLEARGHDSDLADALAACKAAVKADPNSTSGKAATAKLAELQPKYDAWKAAQDARVAALEKAKAEAAKAQAEADAKCHRWATICTIGRFPDGSEQTTGIQYFDTKAECQGTGAALGGVPCDPCHCAD